MLICFPVLLGLPTTQEVGRTGVLIALFRDIELFVPQTVKNLSAVQEIWVPSLGQKILWGRAWQPTPVFLPGESHGQRSLAGCSILGSQRVGKDRATDTLTLEVRRLTHSGGEWPCLWGAVT